jgi:hypothetical protein
MVLDELENLLVFLFGPRLLCVLYLTLNPLVKKTTVMQDQNLHLIIYSLGP